MAAVFIAFIILGFALTAWVYFDAAERDKAAIVWAGLVLFFSWLFLIPLILYVIFRDSGHRRLVPPRGGQRQYLYIASFAGIATLLTGVTLLVTTTIVRAISEEEISRDDYRGALAGALSSIIIGAAVWGYHWFKTNSRLDAMSDDQEFRATFHLHRVYVYTVLGIAWIAVFVTSLWGLGGALAQLLDVEDLEPQDWLPALGPLIVAFVTIGYHYVWVLETPWFKGRQERFDRIEPPPVIEASAPTCVVLPALMPVAAVSPARPSLWLPTSAPTAASRSAPVTASAGPAQRLSGLKADARAQKTQPAAHHEIDDQWVSDQAEPVDAPSSAYVPVR